MNDGRGFNLVANCLADGVVSSTLGGFGLKDEELKGAGPMGTGLVALPAPSNASAAVSSPVRLLTMSGGRGRDNDGLRPWG